MLPTKMVNRSKTMLSNKYGAKKEAGKMRKVKRHVLVAGLVDMGKMRVQHQAAHARYVRRSLMHLQIKMLSAHLVLQVGGLLQEAHHVYLYQCYLTLNAPWNKHIQQSSGTAWDSRKLAPYLILFQGCRTRAT
jgi:hypothetical protein